MNSITEIIYYPVAKLIIPTCNSVLELMHLIGENYQLIYKSAILAAFSFTILTSLGYYQLATWCLKWVGLGILSSIGFGFGMHTFVLFLAPHIAAVTLASQSCNSLDFPEPPYPNEIICPLEQTGSDITFLMIMRKIGLESFMWGLGTAIGELPPYLAARLRAQSKEWHKRNGHDGYNVESMPTWESWMIYTIRKVGFFGILICAAIPNPLFDAAGVASGIAQVPFISFFGATFLGKAVAKVLLQTSFVVFLFHNNNIDNIINQINVKLCEMIPSLKDLNLHRSLVSFLEEQRLNVLKKKEGEPKQPTLVIVLFNWIIFAIMCLFVVSVINNLDKQYKARRSIAKNRKID